MSKKRETRKRRKKKNRREKGKKGKEKDEEKRRKERKKELGIEKEEREVVHEVDTQAELLTGDAAGLGTTKDHEAGKEGEAEVETDGEAERLTGKQKP
ncbi:hypothetical protein GW7_13715 [Heterocephalus glaber]|uniref:Uncharacterized protein n=1 Tax=Heterocephalus glaber TaxID=10181 RepID=G5APJ8_HETGA|nr:hypothetical protein GW7_13715 [Heterocephalus glaber]